jgi:hypothetical protein
MAEGTSGPRDVLKLAKDAGPQTVDLRFCDLPGLMQHFSIPFEEFTEEGFADGYGFDGSSVRGYQEIQESLVPDPVAAYIDPFLKVPTLAVHCFVRDPITGEMYSRPPAGWRRRPGCTSRRPASRTPRGDRSASYTSSPRSGSTRNQDEGNYQIDSVARSPQQSDSSPPRSDYGCNRAKIDRRAGRLIGIGGDDGSPGDPLRLADATPSTAPGRRPPTATRSSRTCITPGSR